MLCTSAPLHAQNTPDIISPLYASTKKGDGLHPYMSSSLSSKKATPERCKSTHPKSGNTPKHPKNVPNINRRLNPLLKSIRPPIPNPINNLNPRKIQICNN